MRREREREKYSFGLFFYRPYPSVFVKCQIYTGFFNMKSKIAIMDSFFVETLDRIVFGQLQTAKKK